MVASLYRANNRFSFLPSFLPPFSLRVLALFTIPSFSLFEREEILSFAEEDEKRKERIVRFYRR